MFVKHFYKEKKILSVSCLVYVQIFGVFLLNCVHHTTALILPVWQKQFGWFFFNAAIFNHSALFTRVHTQPPLG